VRMIKKRALRKDGVGGGEAVIELVVHVVGLLDLELAELNGRVITANYHYMRG